MGLFGSLFSKKQKEPAYTPLKDFSSFGADMHSHLIPGIDDGVKTLEESLDMIRQFSALGFRKLVTTPHIMSDFYRNTPEIINEGLALVKAAVAKENIPVELEAAAEYYFDEMLLKKISEERLLTIGGKYLLFEISYMNPTDNLQGALFEMNLQGYTPLLAHPERYPFWHMRWNEYRQLKDAGVLFQLNVNSLAGYYGPGVKKAAERMVDENMVDFIGSDLHGQRHMDALQKVLGEKYLWKLAEIGVRNASL